MNRSGFTVLEMMIVLSIVGLLFLITLPNIKQKQAIIERKGCEALVEVVNGQILLYEIENLESPSSISSLIQDGYLKESQSRCPNGHSIEIRDGEAFEEQ